MNDEEYNLEDEVVDEFTSVSSLVNNINKPIDQMQRDLCTNTNELKKLNG